MSNLILISAIARLLLLPANQAQPQKPGPSQAAQVIPDLQSRLQALVPDDAMPYFLLGEEVADEADNAEEIRLARHLLVIAYEIEREQDQGRTLGASICLALRHIERVEDARTWLSALAGSLDPRYARRDWSDTTIEHEDSDAALRTARMLGLIRAGQGARALTLRDDPDVVEMLDRYGALLGQGSLAGLDTQIRSWPCPECHNERAVTRQGSRGAQTRLCNTCLGNPGDDISRAQLIAHLRFESRLLNGVRRSWSAQAAMDRAAPLLDPEPDALAPQLAVRYDIDPSLRYWRNGDWIADPSQ